MYSLRNYEVRNALEFAKNMTELFLLVLYALMCESLLFQERPVKIRTCFYHSEISERHVFG